VHDLAIIGKNVSLRDEVQVGPDAMIEDNVKIGWETVIESLAIVGRGTIIGYGCFPADFDIIRGCITIHCLTNEARFTKIGNVCLLQSGAHVAHSPKCCYFNAV
jgi:acyl-[acyl carrier protein]--UDP-N-acetylglucosamine O-acyltransferase